MSARSWNRLVVLVVMVAVSLALPREATAVPLFPNPVSTVGANPYGLAMADFNGDGTQDLVVSNAGRSPYDGRSGDLSLLLGRGDGTFAAEVRVPTQRHAADVLAADVDRDGAADLIVSYLDGTAVLMRGGPGATFGPETLIATNVNQMRPANINNDGIPDLLIDGFGSVFQALIGQGDGTFGAADPVSPGPSFKAIAADVNGDGRDDVLTMSVVSGFAPNLIQIYQGAGDGTFLPAGNIATGEYASLILPADLDGDGDLDLGVDTIHQVADCCAVTGPFILYFGNGDGTFKRGPSADGVLATGLIAADLNGDGHQDYVRVGDSDVTPFLGNGRGTYAEQPFFFTGHNVTRVVGGDFERDGRVDLAILANFSEAVFIYSGNGNGGFGPAINETIRDFLGGLVTDDFNGDGRLDIAAALLLDDQVTFLPGNGDGTFGAEIRSPAGVAPVFLASADVNLDGRKDLVVATRNWHDQYPDVLPNGSIVVLAGNGDGSFQAPVSYTVGLDPQALHVRDLDGDGVPDVLVSNSPDTDVEPDLSLLRGNGDGTLGPETRLPIGAENVYPYGWTWALGLASGDFDRDGRRDIAVAMTGLPEPGVPGTVRVLHGLGGGAFGEPVTVAGTVGSAAVTVSDLDGDGAEDIVVADAARYFTFEPGGLYVLHNDGSGGFTASGLLDAGIGPFDVQVADLTADGVADLVATNIAGYMAILPGLGGGAYGGPLNFGLFGIPLAMVSGDFNADGLADVLVMSESGAFVMQNQVFPRLAIDARISFGGALGRGSGTVIWTTSSEHDLAGFNLVEETPQGLRQINGVTIPCEECSTDLGHTYTYFVPKHKNGRRLFIQAVHRDGRIETFGPARKE